MPVRLATLRHYADRYTAVAGELLGRSGRSVHATIYRNSGPLTMIRFEIIEAAATPA